MPAVKTSQWRDHSVIRLNPDGDRVELPARSQIVTESWNRVVAVPHIVYMPETDRVLMLASCDYPGSPWVHHAMVLFSDDRGATWSEPACVHTDEKGNPACGLGHGLTNLGGGRLMLYSCHPPARWFSDDYGATWGDTVPVAPAPGERTWMAWDPALVDRDPQSGRVTRLMETGYWGDSGTMDSQAYVRFSADSGRTWTGAHHVPEFEGVNEVCPVRAANGDIVATCRTDPPEALKPHQFDHYEGFGVSISRDNGYTWSEVRQLYDWGRHHASLALLPCGHIVATYVVRLGYPDTVDGFPRFGIEAVVTRDNGQTWDLDRRYVLAEWTGNKKGSSSARGKAALRRLACKPSHHVLSGAPGRLDPDRLRDGLSPAGRCLRNRTVRAAGRRPGQVAYRNGIASGAPAAKAYFNRSIEQGSDTAKGAGMISDQQVEFFRTFGFLPLREAFSPGGDGRDRPYFRRHAGEGPRRSTLSGRETPGPVWNRGAPSAADGTRRGTTASIQPWNACWGRDFTGSAPRAICT